MPVIVSTNDFVITKVIENLTNTGNSWDILELYNLFVKNLVVLRKNHLSFAKYLTVCANCKNALTEYGRTNATFMIRFSVIFIVCMNVCWLEMFAYKYKRSCMYYYLAFTVLYSLPSLCILCSIPISKIRKMVLVALNDFLSSIFSCSFYSCFPNSFIYCTRVGKIKKLNFFLLWPFHTCICVGGYICNHTNFYSAVLV